MKWGMTSLALMGLFSVSLPVRAQETFKDVEYISGKDGFEKKVKGLLQLDEATLRLTDKKGKVVFEMPLATVTEVSASREQESGSFGRKMALGIFASKDQEYLIVKTETEATAEAIVFKCKKNTSDAMATKINFQLKKDER